MNVITGMKGLIFGWVVFFMACHAVGRPDIPLTILWRTHNKVIRHVDKPWGCPSPFNRNVCKAWKGGQ